MANRIETAKELQRALEALSDYSPFLSVLCVRGLWSVNLSCNKASVVTIDKELGIALWEAFVDLRRELSNIT